MIQLLALLTVLTTIALTPKLVHIQVTPAGRELVNAITDYAPEIWSKAKTAYQETRLWWVLRIASAPEEESICDDKTSEIDAKEPLPSEMNAIADRVKHSIRGFAHLNNGDMRQLAETQQQRMARLERTAIVRSDAEATAKRVRQQALG